MQDLHVHTIYDDGQNTVQEMTAQALKSGLDSVGICVHSPISGESWCASEEAIPAFVRDVRTAAGTLDGTISVYCGLEYDSVSEPEFRPFDYVIGSVHVLNAAGGPWYYDESRVAALRMIEQVYRGDRDQAAEDYFSRVGALADIPEIDIVGHFDLLTKFNEPEPLYDTSSKRYRDAAAAAMEQLVRAGKIFEINTGAVSRGYRTGYYPSSSLLELLRSLNGRICISSDSHSISTLGFHRNQARNIAMKSGFVSVWELCGNTFSEREL